MSAAIRQDRPALSGNVIPAQHVHMVAGVASPPETGSVPTPPRITLIREGDRVSGIEVVCSCGEVIRLDCVY